MAVGPHRIRLGRTPLASLPALGPNPVGPWPALGARRFSYAEQHYFGNPGGYLHWGVGVSDSGSPARTPIGCDGDGWGSGELADYRRRARINSALIVGSRIDPASVLSYGIAPDYDRVRLLELRHPARVALAARCRNARHAVLRLKVRRQRPDSTVLSE
ncbi:hypothetical protein JIW86_41300 (plasmid) [Streptomyces sp. NBC_00162]|nr:hypothetical protein JIW86_41300 [Streptomyces sp. NBC_00162]